MIQLEPRLNVIAEAGSGEETLCEVLASRPDVAVLDVDMPSGDGFTTARALARQQSSVKIVFLTLYHDELHLNEALDIGAKRYLVKDSAAADVVECIKTVAAGAHYVSPALSSYLLRRGQAVPAPAKATEEHTANLTPAERRVLTHLAGYKTNKQIALELGVSIRSVENHRANLCEKLGLQGSHALVRYAIKNLKD